MNVAPTPQRPLPWYPLEPEDTKRLRKAVKEDGFASPYATHLLEEISTNLCTPHDWTSLARAILTPGQYVDWRAHFNAEAEKQITLMHQFEPPGLGVPLEAFLGMGPYVNPAVYLQAPNGFWIQLREVAMRAFRSCSAAKPEKFTKLTQGKDEDFASFVSRVTETCERKVLGEQAQTALAKELIFEGASPACKQAILPIKEKAMHDWVLACSNIDSSAASLAQAIATAMALTSGCFRCGKTGHFAKNCTTPSPPPTKPQWQQRKPPTPCPRCNKGYHWARDCRANNKAQPLNLKGGMSQPRPQETQTRAKTGPKP